MSPSVVDPDSPELGLRIVGLGTEYPAYQLGPEALDTLAERYYPTSSALSKVLTINQYTGINTRSAIGNVDHPIANQPHPPSISEVCDIFMKEGVALSVAACKKAIKEWGGSVDEITHVVSTTCTNSANPGFDHFVVTQLGINPSVEKVLLHGVGCSGGLAALRTAANIALGASFLKKPARILVLACEISSVLVRSEMDSISEKQEVRIGVTLFSDCASAAVLSNDIGKNKGHAPVYDLLGWKFQMIEGTEEDLGFDVHPLGWKVVLTPRVAKLTAGVVPQIYENLIKSIPEHATEDGDARPAADFDWALHPGGLTIITGVEQAMKLTPEHLRASYDIYVNHGNSSSATIFSVMDRLRKMGEGKEHVIGCAFGPGISVEMVVLKRRKGGACQLTAASNVVETLTLEEPLD